MGAEARNEEGEILHRSWLEPGLFSWSSSAPDIATMNVTTCGFTARRCRVVTGLSEGNATITATSEGLTGTMTVNVRDRARVAWSVPVGEGWVSVGVAVGTDGTIYVVSSQYGTTSRLTALSPEGSVVWTLTTASRVRSIPAIGDDGTLYLGSWSTDTGVGRLIAVDPGGTVRWILEDLDPIRSSPAIGPDGTIYVAGRNHVYAVDPQGEIRWTFERASEETVFFVSSPGIASDGTIYVGGEDHQLYAIDPDGSLRWTFRAGDRIRSSPSIGTDGTIYFGSFDGRLYAVNPDGTERWSLGLHCGLPWGCQRINRSASIGPDGTIYVIASHLYAVDPNGSIRWSEPVSGRTPILGADGTVYVSPLSKTARRSIAALDSKGRLLWDYHSERSIRGSLALGVDGTIIAGAYSGAGEHPSLQEGFVYGILETDPTNGGFEGAPWPTERGDRANTGRAGG